MISVRTKEKEINDVVYKIHELTFGQSNEIISLSEAVDSKTGLVYMSMAPLKLHTILKACPQLEREVLEAMPQWESNVLFEAIAELNEPPLETSPPSS